MDTARIRALNDAFRTSFSGGKVLLTAVVDALPDADKVAVLDKVRMFAGFDADNDPHREHDFVAVEHGGERYFPNGEPVVTRVLTIMLAEEY
jgi:hypothetical protein